MMQSGCGVPGQYLELVNGVEMCRKKLSLYNDLFFARLCHAYAYQAAASSRESKCGSLYKWVST